MLTKICFFRCHSLPVDEGLQQRLIAFHAGIAEQFVNANNYNRLTQSYLRKPFALFELLLHHILPQTDAITSVATDLKTYEHIETATNVLLLLFCHKNHIEFDKQDFSPLEIDFVAFLCRDGRQLANLYAHLPTVDELYTIAGNRDVFYPFGTIKAYTALSILIDSDSHAIKQLNLEQVLTLMKSVSTDREIDDVANATWKYLNSILLRSHIDLRSANECHLEEIVSHLSHVSQTYKSAELRYKIVFLHLL